jgi:hypothetical protein
MNSLALLCNLHGDGPATLAALRTLGCSDLGGVPLVSSSEFVDIFGGDQKTALRFQREAQILAERLGEQPLQQFQKPQLTSAQEALAMGNERSLVDPNVEGLAPQQEPQNSTLLTPFPSLSTKRPTPTPVTPLEPSPAPTPRLPVYSKGAVVHAVLDLWKRLDSTESGAPAQPNPTSASATTVSSVQPSAGSLAEAGLDGLTDAILDQLTGVGVTTVSQLLEADILALAKQVGLPYTKLAHLQFLGRSSTGSSGKPPLILVPKQASVEVPKVQSQPTEPGLPPAMDEVSQGDGGSAGPFA